MRRTPPSWPPVRVIVANHGCAAAVRARASPAACRRHGHGIHPATFTDFLARIEAAGWVACWRGVLACGPSCRAGYGHVPRTGTLREAGGSDSRPGPVQSALLCCLSKQRIDTRLPAWAGGFESGKHLGIDTHVQRGSLLRQRWAAAAKLILALKHGGAIEERFVEFWCVVWINPSGSIQPG